MNKIVGYIKIILFLLTGLSILSFITQNPSSAPARFQFNHVSIVRELADFLCLCSILFLTYRQWKPNGTDNYFIVSMCLFLFISILDIHVWLWWTSTGSLYLLLTIVHSLPIPYLLNQTFSNLEIKTKTFFVAGFVICVLGFLYDIVFINIPIQDITPELFEKNMRQEKIKNWFYYIGILIAVTGFVKRISEKKAAHRPA